MRIKGLRPSGSPIVTTNHPDATTVDYALTTPALADPNDKAWGLMYKALVDGLNVDPRNFQLIYPFVTWDWPIGANGYTSAAQWDFVSDIPQWSATGQYTSAGASFNDAYAQMLNVVAADTTDPKLKSDIESARNVLQLASNNFDTIYQQAKAAYATDTGGANTPTFTQWLGELGGKSWEARLDSASKEVDAAQRVLNQLLSETTTPGLSDAQARLVNPAYTTKFQDSTLSNFPPVPAYSLTTDATTWLNNVQAKGGMSGTISFANSDSSYDYKNTWAEGSASVGNFFWSAKVGGSWQRIEEFSTDNSLEVTLSFQAWDQIQVAAGRWYNGAFTTSVANGPFIRGYSAKGGNGDKAVWGKDGIMSVQKVGMVVCYKPSFSISVSSSSFQSFYETWKVASSLRIGPFEISGGGGSTSSDWKANSSSNTFTGSSTAETAFILGVNIALINS